MTRHVVSSTDEAAARSELTATGTLRVGVVAAPAVSPLFVVMGADGAPRGVTVDLGAALAERLRVPVAYFVAPNTGQLTDATVAGEIDVTFMPADDDRRKKVAFGPAYFIAESTCLVHGHSDFKTNSDLDRTNVRVVGIAHTTTIRSAERLLKSATIVAAPSVGEAMAMLRGGEADAVALSRDSLRPYCREIPGTRILDGSLQTTGVAVAVPRDRPIALAYCAAFIEDAKRSGLIRQAFDRAGLQLDEVAPPESGGSNA
jgi:polar amino acid transport system substrate-binding protein